MVPSLAKGTEWSGSTLKDSSATPNPPHPTCRQRAAVHKVHWLAELAVHLGHRWVEAEALLDTHGQVGHLAEIIPANNQPVISGGGKLWGPVERQAPAPPCPLHHPHTPESQRDTSAPRVHTRRTWGGRSDTGVLTPLFSLPPSSTLPGREGRGP